jgi:hypothetical protein
VEEVMVAMAVRIPASVQRCETCGFEWAQLSPPDAATAARSLGRRWRQLLELAVGGDDCGVDLVHRHQPGGWSIVGHGAHVAEVLERKAVALAAVRDHHRPVLPADIEAPHASDDTVDAADVAGDIAGAAEMLARTIESISGDDWLRIGVLVGRDVTAANLALDAVHEATHHLRAAEDALAEAGVAPDEEGRDVVAGS